MKLVNSTKTVAMVLFVTVWIPAAARSQVRGRQDAFATVPREERTKLMDQLQVFVTAQSERRWSDMYDMSLNAIDHSTTKETFIKDQENGLPDRHSFELLGFTPEAATVVNAVGESKEWLIEGCAKYRESGKTKRWQAGLNARLYDGRWYFSSLAALTRGVDGPPIPCAKSSKANNSRPKRRRAS